MKLHDLDKPLKQQQEQRQEQRQQQPHSNDHEVEAENWQDQLHSMLTSVGLSKYSLQLCKLSRNDLEGLLMQVLYCTLLL